MVVPEKINIKLQNDPIISHMGVYQKEIKLLAQRQICIPMFIEALFIKTKIYILSKCLTVDEYKENVKHIYITHT